MALSFLTTARDRAIIDKIVRRGRAFDKALQAEWDARSCTMDIAATHASGCALRLDEMLAADDFNFCHDWYGIRNCIDRSTGEMRNNFWPRFAQPDSEQIAA